MSKRIFLLTGFFAIMLSLILSSCSDCMEGNGKMAVRTATFTEITEINLSVSADVVLVADSSGTVKIEGESNIIEAILLEQKGKSLRIKSEPCFSANKPITITIPMKTISELQINGSGSIKTGNKLVASDLGLKINGSGDIDLDVDAGNVKSEINGSGNVVLKGAAQRHKIEINGSGNVDAENFPTGNVSITVNGSGDCKVLATTALAIKIRGSGSVYYAGAPDISSDIKGSGSLQKLK
ncbi:MAG: head GIN domain-containing protein [Bacteroidota bacterium]